MSSIGTHLMGAFSDASGRRITTVAFPIVRSFRGRALQLVGTGDSYALFWKDWLDRTYLTDIDLNGQVTRTTMLALPQHIASARRVERPAFLRGAAASGRRLVQRRGRAHRAVG